MWHENKSKAKEIDRRLYWVGSRFSDSISFLDKLSGTICLYGKSEGENLALSDIYGARFDNNNLTDDVNERVKELMFDIARKDEKAAFYFYNPGWKYDIGGFEEIENRLLCVNKKELYDFYDSKINVYNRYSPFVKTLQCQIFDKSECSYQAFEDSLGENEAGYIVQSEKASGGLGTLVIDKTNIQRLQSLKDGRYIVSKYEKRNIPVNYHAVIYNNDIIILSGSVQIMRREDDRLIYKGADYVAYQTIDENTRKALRDEVRKACTIMQSDGYRGVVGVDAMIYGDKIALIELNTRFQGSTAALNLGLERLGCKTVQELNLEAFENDVPSEADKCLDSDMPIQTSCYFYGKIAPTEHSDLIYKNAPKESHVTRFDLDGYTQNDEVQDGIYKFRLCFDTNICAVNKNMEIWLHENVCEPDFEIYQKVKNCDPLALKITLMSQGVRINDDAAAYLRANGGIREGNNNAVDIFVRNMVVNAPCTVEFNAFAPYEIRMLNNRIALYYYENFIDFIGLYPLDPLSEKYTKSGRKYSEVAYLSTDRLRVHMTDKCIYKKLGKSCRFCNIDTEESGKPITLEEIVEVVEDYLDNAKELKHFLIGGQSAEEHSEKSRIVEMIKAVRKRTDKPIYVMSLPFSTTTVEEMKEAGMTELACNMEVFDDVLAAEIMPGKGRIPRSHYCKVLSHAAKLFEKKGVVRSALIVGLESHESFMNGLKTLLVSGVQPILSVFRPLPNTDLSHLIMPPAVYLYNVFIEAERLCRSYGMSLGPDCVNCQNNTLSVPNELALQYL